MANADTQDTSSRPLGTNATLQTASLVQDTSAVLTPPEKDEKAGKTASFRGPLRYETETSSLLVEAGRTFFIYLRITNPYEVPVQITEASFRLPVEFQDEPLREPGSRRRGSGEDHKPIARDGATANPFLIGEEL